MYMLHVVHVLFTSLHVIGVKVCFPFVISAACTVFIRIVATATINFAPSSVRLLIEGGSYSRVATIHFARAMIDAAACMRSARIRMYIGQRPPNKFIARAATIRGRLLFLCAHAACGYYSMCGYYSNKYGN